MERLSSAYAYLWETCGPWGIALLACMIILFFVQFWYWVGYYGRIPSYRNARAGDARPPVSVALVVHEPDYDFLENGLPVLLGQEYDDFEIIVTDLSGDVEFGEALAVIAEHNPRFNVTRMVRDARFPISDKMAFNVAIKAARYDNILLTTVDSRPASLQWIARMARGFDGAGIVIGYCGMEGASAFSSRLIRLDNAARAIRWLSAAMHGKPYRGTLQNIGFTKALYFGNGGFNYLNMNIGEDDLFIQKLLETGTAAAVIVSSNSTVRQKIMGRNGLVVCRPLHAQQRIPPLSGEGEDFCCRRALEPGALFRRGGRGRRPVSTGTKTLRGRIAADTFRPDSLRDAAHHATAFREGIDEGRSPLRPLLAAVRGMDGRRP